jgi:hypothetical protein
MSRIGGMTAALMVVVLAALVPQAVAGGSRAQWFSVALANGKIEGYRWAVGAKGPKHEPLDQICTLVSMVEPPQGEDDVVEGRDATDCGRLKLPTDSVSSTDSLGSGESRVTVLEAIYRPLVRKVAIGFAAGGPKVYRTRAPQLSNRAEAGIPMFRYIVAPVQSGNCIRRVTAFDGRGKVVSSQASPPC